MIPLDNHLKHNDMYMICTIQGEGSVILVHFHAGVAKTRTGKTTIHSKGRLSIN